MKHIITKDKLEDIVFDDVKNELHINFRSGGYEGSLCGLVLKVKLVEKKSESYKQPKIETNDDNTNSF